MRFSILISPCCHIGRRRDINMRSSHSPTRLTFAWPAYLYFLISRHAGSIGEAHLYVSIAISRLEYALLIKGQFHEDILFISDNGDTPTPLHWPGTALDSDRASAPHIAMTLSHAQQSSACTRDLCFVRRRRDMMRFPSFIGFHFLLSYRLALPFRNLTRTYRAALFLLN